MILGLLTVLYVLLTIFRPKPIDWKVTLEKKDKNPYGAFIVYHRLKDLFPHARIVADQLPVYNQVRDTTLRGTAYVMVAPQAGLQKEDVARLLQYITLGNDAFISAFSLSKALTDTLRLELSGQVRDLLRKDSIRISLTNPGLAGDSGYIFRRFTLNNYFSKLDTARTEVLGFMDGTKPDFIRMRFGAGYLYVQSAPLCFSNYFMLFGTNYRYTAAALSYLPQEVHTIFWDEYYKQGSGYKGGLLRFFLSHLYLRWAWLLALGTMVLFLVFESKRRQRVIPPADPVTNTSLEFVRTVGNLYFNRHDNKNIADKKIAYFLEFVRSRLNLSTGHLDQEFIAALARKGQADESQARILVDLILRVQSSGHISDPLLLELNKRIDDFCKNITS